MEKTINGYTFDDNCGYYAGVPFRWRAKKGHTEYFFKRFTDPTRPSDRVSEAVRKQKNEICEDFLRERKRVISSLRTLIGGNIIVPFEFFEHERRFYQATKWIQIKPKTLKEISSLSEKIKVQLLKVAALNLKAVHNKGIVHLDVKPYNLPVCVNEVSGKLFCILRDFDSSYFENALPLPEWTAATGPYMSPELASYKMKDPRYGNKVTSKNDVFALAIVFHEYWTGRDFIFDDSEDGISNRFLYQVVDSDEKVSVAPGVPDWLEDLLQWMIKKNPDERPTMEEVVKVLEGQLKNCD